MFEFFFEDFDFPNIFCFNFNKLKFQMSGEIKDQNVAASTESNKEKVVLCRLSKLENLILKKQNLTVFP